MDLLKAHDTKLFQTDTLIVWIRRPSPSHQNWRLCYYSTDEAEARSWDGAIETVAKKLELSPFHQGCWPHDHPKRHPNCSEQFPYHCPGVTQAWEMWLGCSEWGLHFYDSTLAEIIACGDPALEQILAAVPAIREQAAQR